MAIDLNEFFNEIDARENEAVSSATGSAQTVSTIPMAKSGDTYKFTLFIGEDVSRVRFVIDNSVKKSNPHHIDNITALNNAIFEFGNRNKGEEVWLEIPTMPNSSDTKAYKARLIYVLANQFGANNSLESEPIVGFRFPYPDDLPSEQNLKWLELNGYFYLSGEIIFEDGPNPIITEAVFHSVNYIDKYNNRKQDVVPYVPF